MMTEQEYMQLLDEARHICATLHKLQQRDPSHHQLTKRLKQAGKVLDYLTEIQHDLVTVPPGTWTPLMSESPDNQVNTVDYESILHPGRTHPGRFYGSNPETGEPFRHTGGDSEGDGEERNKKNPEAPCTDEDR